MRQKMFRICFLFITSCQPSFPIQKQKPYHDLKDELKDFSLRFPDEFIKKLDDGRFYAEYYITSIPGNAGVQKTGYSIRLKYIGQEKALYKNREFRGYYVIIYNLNKI